MDVAATPVVEEGLVGIFAGGYADLSRRVSMSVMDAVGLPLLLDCVLNVLAPIASQKPLAVDRALVLGVESSVDDIAHGHTPCAMIRWLSGASPAHCDFRTLKYHSESKSHLLLRVAVLVVMRSQEVLVFLLDPFR